MEELQHDNSLITLHRFNHQYHQNFLLEKLLHDHHHLRRPQVNIIFFVLIDGNIEFVLYIFLGSQQKFPRAAPPPPPHSQSANPPLNSNNNGHTASVTLNPDTVTKFNSMMNQNDSHSSTPPVPPPPPRAVPATNPGATVRRPPPPLSDVNDNIPAQRRSDQGDPGALLYDYDFEARFQFTPIENLPPPELWKPLPPSQPQTKSSKNVNAN